MLREKRHALAPSGRVEPNTLPTVGIRCRVGDGRSEAAPLEQLVVEQKSARTSRGIAVNLEVPRSAIEGVPCEHLPLDGVGWKRLILVIDAQVGVARVRASRVALAHVPPRGIAELRRFQRGVFKIAQHDGNGIHDVRVASAVCKAPAPAARGRFVRCFANAVTADRVAPCLVDHLGSDPEKRVVQSLERLCGHGCRHKLFNGSSRLVASRRICLHDDEREVPEHHCCPEGGLKRQPPTYG